nr:MAG TPA: Nuf2 family protein [Caudoviricetes sp.]
MIQHIPVQLWPMDVSLTDITRHDSSRFRRLI